MPLLAEAGVTHINISLDTMIPQKFEFISRRKGLGISHTLFTVFVLW